MNEIKRPVLHLSRLPLPAYKHRPGITPHPMNHPDGHSRISLYEVQDLPPARWTEEVAYLRGVDLYNYGYFWEAHEAWEALWQCADRDGFRAFFLKGLIQLSASLLHLSAGKRPSFKRVSGRALGYLDQIPDHLFMGLYLPEFLARWRGFRIKCHIWKDRYPFIVL